MNRYPMLITLLCFCGVLLASCNTGSQVAAVGRPSPNFTLTDLEGNVWRLSELKGQVVFVNFWATWCPPCREEMPSMQRLFDRMPSDKFKMLAILNKDTTEKARSFAEDLGLSMPILNDQDDVIGKQYGLTGLPETFIVDKNGVLRDKFIGPAEWDSTAITRKLMNYINM